MPVSFSLPGWYDLHAHFRQEELLRPTVQAHLAMGCSGVLAMPNTAPPVACVRRGEVDGLSSIEAYRAELDAAADGQLDEIIVPLYLSAHTSVAMIEQGARDGLLQAVKYYPPHGTTGAGHSRPLQHFIDNGVLDALQAVDGVLCLHGEQHGLRGEAWLGRSDSAEEHFYRETMPRLLDRFPRLRMVAEHVSTRVAVDLVRQGEDRLAASVTPQHLLYTLGDLLQNFRYHLYCLPLVKFAEDREALRDAVTASDNHRFFAGTDSAPHTHKVTACGCAAGCFTGGVALQLYAMAFEQAGSDLSIYQNQQVFEGFVLHNGARFYRLPLPQGNLTLTRSPSTVVPLDTPQGQIVPLPLGMGEAWSAVDGVLDWTLSLG